MDSGGCGLWESEGVGSEVKGGLDKVDSRGCGVIDGGLDNDCSVVSMTLPAAAI